MPRQPQQTEPQLVEHLKQQIANLEDEKSQLDAKWHAEFGKRTAAETSLKERAEELQAARESNRRLNDNLTYHRDNWLRAMGYLDRIREERTSPPMAGPRTGDDAIGEGSQTRSYTDMARGW